VLGLIQDGRIKVDYSECKPLIDEARKLQFDAETGKEDERYRNHACDGFLYLTRAFFPRQKVKAQEPEPGSKEAIDAMVKAERQKQIDDREKRKARV